MDKLVEELILNVVGECSHHFKKDNNLYGATMVYYYLKVIYQFIHLLMKEK